MGTLQGKFITEMGSSSVTFHKSTGTCLTNSRNHQPLDRVKPSPDTRGTSSKSGNLRSILGDNPTTCFECDVVDPRAKDVTKSTSDTADWMAKEKRGQWRGELFRISAMTFKLAKIGIDE